MAPEYKALPAFKDAGGLAEAIGGDYWMTDPDFPEWDCTSENQNVEKVRDQVTGEVEKVTKLECQNQVGEFTYLTVADQSWKDREINFMCDVVTADPNCFALKGWMIEAENRHSLDEMLERLDVDGARWGLA